MAIQGVDTKCYILALFVRDDGERFLLGSGHYEFKDTQMHFAANAIQNDIVEVQGNDGFLLAGQVRRPGTQSFDGYVGDGTMSKEETESYRRQFFSFFRKNFFYKVIYVFSDGTAIQRKSGFLVDDPTVQELYQMYPEYHVALNFEDVNYYSYSEDEEGHEQYAKEATIDLSSMRATGGLEWDNLGVIWENPWSGEQTASGTEITIQNDMSVMSPTKDTKLYGDTYQKTYSGKNLLYVTDGTYTNNQVTWTSNNNTATASGTAGSTSYSALTAFVSKTIPAGTYTFSIKEPVTKRIQFACRKDSSSPQVTNLIPIGSTSVTFTLNEDMSQYHVVCLDAANADFTGFTISEMQLEAGSEATSFEPYTAGPAPNPDYPQDIHVVTGEQTVRIGGKNLWKPAPNGSVTNGGITSVCSNGTITCSGTSTSTAAQTSGFYNLDTPLPAGTYTFSIKNALPYRIEFVMQDSSGTNHFSRIAANSKSGTITTTWETVKIRNGISGYTSGTEINIIIEDLQLEAGSEVTTYQAYQSQSYPINLGSTELCKIGEYQDYIYKSGNDWYVHKAVGKKEILSVNSIYSSAGVGYIGAQVNVTEMLSNSRTNGYSNRFTPINSPSGATTEGITFGAGNKTIYIVLKDSRMESSTGANWNAWLASNNTIVYYPLATPTDTKITDDTLIGHLNALGAMRLFIGENNLAIQATGTNLPAPLSFKYYTTVAMTGAVWEEGGSGGATVVEVDSITNTYPIWRIKGPAVDPQLSVINTNTTIRYTGTVTSTQTLEIDMFNKTAKLNGVSVIGNVSGDWVSLAPGTNRVIYTAENADAQPSTIEWQEVVG